MRTEPYFTFFGLPMGPPQFIAAFLLLCFLGQTLWVGYTTQVDAHLEVMPTLSAHPDLPPHSPFVVLIAEASIFGARLIGISGQYLLWTVRLPFILLGVLIGMSIWYVARRLYGVAGGLAALVLYCFSPTPFVAANPNPVPVAALGLFGVVFNSIAVTHTLYAPPRGSTWGEIRHRWKRVAILGFAIALMLGSAPELAFMIAVALGMMLYLVPHRRADALRLMLAALAMALLLLLAIAGPRWLAAAAQFSPIAGWRAPHFVVQTSIASASVVITVIASLATAVYLASRRSRYFGNTAPLLATALTVVLGLPSLGHAYAGPFPAWSLPLLFVFVGGIFADLAETDLRRPAVLVFVVLAASLATLDLLAVAQHQAGGKQLSPSIRFRRIRI